MRYNSLVLSIVLLSQGLSGSAWAQTTGAGMPGVALCDPYLDTKDVTEDNGDQQDNTYTRNARYDLETSEVLSSQDAVIDAIFEEKWDIASGNPIERNELCQGVPTYIVNWAQLVGPGTDGKNGVLANGYFSLRKDGSFEFDFNKRPYSGTWTFTDGALSLAAPWLNNGEPLVGPVEHVKTPIELTYGDGRTDSYTEEVYRIGPFRLLPIDTTVKGASMNCACPVK